MRVGDVVVVHWLDATGPADLEPDEDLDVIAAQTAGRVRYADHARVVLAAEWFTDGRERDVTAIPRISITNIEVLRHAP